MLYENPSRASTPFLHPSPSPEIIVLPPSTPPVSPDHWEMSYWAQSRVQRPPSPPYVSSSSTQYDSAQSVPESHNVHGTRAPQPSSELRDSNYSTPYNTAPIFPRSLSVHGTPASRSHPEPLGLDYPAPPSLPTTPGIPPATLGWPPPTPTIQAFRDLAYPRSLRDRPWLPPAISVPPPNRLQVPMDYLLYQPYNASPNMPQSPSVNSVPASQPLSEPPSSYHLHPSALPATPGISQTTLGGSPTSSSIRVSADFMHYPTLLHGAPLSPPEVIPPPTRTPTNYPYYPAVPYGAIPFIPPLPSPSARSSPASQWHSELPGSYYPEPSALPITPEIPQAILGGPLVTPNIQVPAYFTGYLTFLHGSPWSPPQAMTYPSEAPRPWPGQHPTIGFNQPLPAPWPPMIPPMGPSKPVVSAWPLPAGMPPYPASGHFQTQQPEPRTGDTSQAAFLWIDNVDRMDPFTDGPHYGPVLEPFQAKIVNAVIRLNPLLAPPKGDHSGWNMLFHWDTSNCYRVLARLSGRDAPATHPRLSYIRIISRALPWMIHVRAQNPKVGVTCGEVLDAISAHMHGHVGKKECEHLPAARNRQIWENYRFNRSTNSNVPGRRLGGSLKRLDWLGKASWFGGLVVNEAFVKERCGDVLPCTFELMCLENHASTTEEVLEQQSRPENSSRHRSGTWPMSYLGSSVGLDKVKQSIEGLSRSRGTTEPGDIGMGSRRHSYSQSGSTTLSVAGASPSAPGLPMDMSAPITGPPIRFNHTGEFSGFVNDAPYQVMYKNRLYPTALHLLEALKFTHQPALQERIRACKDVNDMYPLSASFQEHVRPDWGRVFLIVMEDVLYLKFKQHPTLWVLLLQTGPAGIVYSDEHLYWGDGPSGQGANELGKALVRLRERLRQEGDA